MKKKQLLTGLGVCVAFISLMGEPAQAITQSQLDLDCFNASAMFGIRTNQTWGFAPDYVRNWWTANNCNDDATDANTCSRISGDYGVSVNVTWGYAPTDVQEWWTEHSCNVTASRTPCESASLRYGIAANVSWGLAPEFVKTFWEDNSCNTTYASFFNVTQCGIASFYYRIRANDTWGWAPSDVTPTSIDVQQWWIDNSCTTSP